jgi:hypothetical protein
LESDVRDLIILILLILSAVLLALSAKNIGAPRWYLGWAGMCAFVVAYLIQFAEGAHFK